MAVESFRGQPLLTLAWIGTSAAAVDLSVVALDLVGTMPSEQLLGSSVANPLLWAYLVAGTVALLNDGMEVVSG